MNQSRFDFDVNRITARVGDMLKAENRKHGGDFDPKTLLLQIEDLEEALDGQMEWLFSEQQTKKGSKIIWDLLRYLVLLLIAESRSNETDTEI